MKYIEVKTRTFYTLIRLKSIIQNAEDAEKNKNGLRTSNIEHPTSNFG
jgi:hypothetical protein